MKLKSIIYLIFSISFVEITYGEITIPYQGGFSKLNVNVFDSPLLVLLDSQKIAASEKFKSAESFQKIFFYWNYNFEECHDAFSSDFLSQQEFTSDAFKKSVDAAKSKPGEQMSAVTIVAIVNGKIGKREIEYILFTPEVLKTSAEVLNAGHHYGVATLLFYLDDSSKWKLLPSNKYAFLEQISKANIPDIVKIFKENYIFDSASGKFINPMDNLDKIKAHIPLP